MHFFARQYPDCATFFASRVLARLNSGLHVQ
jgi:hypothetical protein